MSVDFRKTLIVGLGGTGTKAVGKMKQEFRSNFVGEDPPRVIQLRCFDTTTGSKSGLLDDVEFTPMQVEDIDVALDGEGDADQWYPRGVTNQKDIMDGAHAIRSSGRLAFFANASKIRQKLQGAIDTVRSMSSEDLTRDKGDFGLTEENKVNAYIVSSLAGGTGSGTFLDFAYMLNSLLSPTDRIAGILLLPTIFENRAGARFVGGNGYASLKELDYWMRGGTRKSIDYGDNISLDWGGDQNPPFDQTYLVDDVSEDRKKVTGIDKILEFLGQSLFSHATVETAKKGQDVIDNISAATMNDPVKGKYPHYIGIGMSNLRLPVEEFIDKKASSESHNFIEQYINLGEDTSIEEEVTSFMESKELREKGFDDVIDAILSENEVDPDLSPISEPETRDDPVTAIKQHRETKLDNARTIYKDRAKENRKEKTENAKEAIRTKINKVIGTKNGVGKLHSFLESLSTRLETCQTLMKKEKKDWEEKREGVEKSKYPTDEQIQDAENHWFNRKPLQNIARDDQKAFAEEAEHIRQIVRRDEALTFFGDLLEFVDDYIGQEGQGGKLTGFKNQLQEAREFLDDKIERAQVERKSDEFTFNLDQAHLEEKFEDVEEINLQRLIKDKDAEAILAWRELTHEELAEKFRSYVRDKLSELKDTDISSVLEEVINSDSQTSKLTEDIQTIVDRATPLWMYKPYGNPETFIILSLPEIPGEDINLESVKDFISDKVSLDVKEPQWASSIDPYRLQTFKIKAGVPGFAVGKENMERFKRDYLTREKKRSGDFTHHIDKEWANEKELPDLFPSKGSEEEEERLRYWSVAFAISQEDVRPQEEEPQDKPLIWTSGSYYYVRSEKLGKEIDDNKLKLANGRVAAFEEFKDNDELFEEIKKKVEKAVQDKGSDYIVSDCEDRIEVLKNANSEGEVRELIGREIEAIKDYISNFDENKIL
ncbi:hypothetical protein KGY79_11090 [Candidatus Bipolaricaulota bacterium]|nr:hypothetical protein [Candidatus Bipolaricaulota bacterium]